MPFARAIPIRMPLNLDQLSKPVRKLRKLLRNVEGMPSPDQVHLLRTHCRRMEANLQAVGLEHTRSGRRLLKTIAPIRKRAGKVRDMDVLTEFAAELLVENKARNQELGDAPIHLLHQLGVNRFHYARQLDRVISNKRITALKRLKQFSRWVDHRRLTDHPSGDVARSQTAPVATAIDLSSALAHWPALNRDNLHAFRLRVKALHYVLDLSSNPNRKLIDALGEVKDSIGEWHDWCELELTARQSIKDSDRLCAKIHSIAENKLGRALATAENLRTTYLNEVTGPNNHQHTKPIQLNRPVLISAAQMGA
jgi:CHAD domain-containing protein